MHTIGAIMGSMVLIRIGNRIEWKSSHLFMVLASSSMIMFLIHQQIIYFTLLLLNGLISPVMNVLVNFCISLVISFIISVLIKKNRTISFLVGEKFGRV